MSRRLNVLLDHVQGPVIADIGCDHAILAVSAVEQGKAMKAYACDIAEGPLARARATIRKRGMTDSVIPLLSDGLRGLPEPCSQIIIAGMGADTILHILNEGIGSLKPGTRFILSPHSKAPVLRKWLHLHGFEITREQFVEDRGHYYPVMDVLYSGMDHQISEPDRTSLLFGLQPVTDSCYRSFLQQEQIRIRRLLQVVPMDENRKLTTRLALLKQRMTESFTTKTE